MNTWIIYTILTVAYIVVLVVYFLRRTRVHEQELVHFLETAKQQLEAHKVEAAQEANQKVVKAAAVVQKVQQVAESFEKQAKTEYDQIIEDAKTEKREIIASAKTEIESLFKQAEKELEEYRLERYREIERNLVKLVVAVTERVVEVGLDEKQHAEIIEKALDEIKQKKARG